MPVLVLWDAPLRAFHLNFAFNTPRNSPHKISNVLFVKEVSSTPFLTHSTCARGLRHAYVYNIAAQLFWGELCGVLCQVLKQIVNYIQLSGRFFVVVAIVAEACAHRVALIKVYLLT